MGRPPGECRHKLDARPTVAVPSYGVQRVRVPQSRKQPARPDSPAASQERPLKRLIAPALAAVVLAGSALPVMAQPYGPPGPGGHGLQLRRRADELEQSIRRG